MSSAHGSWLILRHFETIFWVSGVVVRVTPSVMSNFRLQTSHNRVEIDDLATCDHLASVRETASSR
jgi:hypothetical protein